MEAEDTKNFLVAPKRAKLQTMDVQFSAGCNPPVPARKAVFILSGLGAGLFKKQWRGFFRQHVSGKPEQRASVRQRRRSCL
jgi:hypothetical protein